MTEYPPEQQAFFQRIAEARAKVRKDLESLTTQYEALDELLRTNNVDTEEAL